MALEIMGTTTRIVMSLAACAANQLAAHGRADDGVTLEKNVETRMRDGGALRADVYRPAAPGTYPVLLQRTPY